MEEAIKEKSIYENILGLIKCIYSLVQAARHWFKEYINTTTLKTLIKKCKLDPCLLYRLNELGTTISVIYVDDTLELEEELSLVHTL